MREGRNNYWKRHQKYVFSGILALALCLFSGQHAFAFLSESTTSVSATKNTTQVAGVLTLQVSPISPHNGDVLTHFPANLKVKVTRGGLTVEGARIQFWMEGGVVDDVMHNAGLTMTNSSGYAYITLLNQNTLEPGQYIWYATASKTDFKGGYSQMYSFEIPSNHNNMSNSTGIVSTDKKEYSVKDNGTNVVILGNVDDYQLGNPIFLNIISPSGKIDLLVTYGSYLGGFHVVYKLGANSKLGIYRVSVLHNYTPSPSSSFYLVK